MTLDFARAGQVKVSMRKYVEGVLSIYKVSRKASTLATTSLFNVGPEAEKLSNSMSEKYHSRVAKLLYLAKRIKPDILPPISFLATRVSCVLKTQHGRSPVTMARKR
jgi:hypothetical protein